MTDTLVLLFHPCLAKSKANAALANAAATLPGVEVVDMYALYGDGAIDAPVEIRRLLDAKRVALQFPVQWYAPPALLQAWKDAVLTHMYYIAPETEGSRLEGTPLLVAATAGNTQAAYSADGINLFPLNDMMRPLIATASRCGLPWAKPFYVYETNRLDTAGLQESAERYRAHLHDWIHSPPVTMNQS
jgi:putative NADPH-quinone reductase